MRSAKHAARTGRRRREERSGHATQGWCHRPAPRAGVGRLGDVLASLAVIDVVCAPRGLDVAVGDVVIHDAGEGPRFEAGTIVLAVGVRADEPEAVELTRAAGVARAVAVTFRGEVPDDVREEAVGSGVTLLTLPQEMAWGQAHSLS